MWPNKLPCKLFTNRRRIQHKYNVQNERQEKSAFLSQGVRSSRKQAQQRTTKRRCKCDIRNLFHFTITIEEQSMLHLIYCVALLLLLLFTLVKVVFIIVIILIQSYQSVFRIQCSSFLLLLLVFVFVTDIQQLPLINSKMNFCYRISHLQNDLGSRYNYVYLQTDIVHEVGFDYEIGLTIEIIIFKRKKKRKKKKT